MPSCSRLLIRSLSSGSNISSIDEKPEAPKADFVHRHIGPSEKDINHMLQFCGFNRIEDFISKVIPDSISLKRDLKLENETSEAELIRRLKLLMSKNEVWRSYIGQGYYGTITPSTIQRNIFENPGWYTSYTPYQPEISQGRLESLFNYQTMISDLTGLARANASLLDEGTASAEAMCMAVRNLNIEIEVVSIDNVEHVKEIISTGQFSGYLLQYPDTEGNIWDEKIRAVAEITKLNKTLLITATDLLALTLIESPGSLGADIAVGSSQRFGIPMGFGGPHAAFISDAMNQPAYRLALQTREQHIRRDKATSNICTAQALLANMAAFYAVYHGPEGLKQIASRIHRNTLRLVSALENAGYKIANQTAVFDTIKVLPNSKPNCLQSIRRKAFEKRVNLLYYPNGGAEHSIFAINTYPNLIRKNSYLTHPVFNSFHSETELLRYMKKLENKDISLVHSMIPLGSCTMKLNGTTELLACSWDNVNKLHPFVPKNQVTGYLELIAQLENDIKEITGYDYVSLAPNSGAQGEYAGLKAIRGYLDRKGEHKRTICLIPTSAHGTNPASAQMAGMTVKHVKTTSTGSLDMNHLEEQTSLYKDHLAAIMITYPSTFGVFDSNVQKVCEIVHEAGGQVFMDGANLNAQVGLCRPGDIGSDVSHINLHKTFSIPHGGGGPGCGPVCAKSHLAPFLPQHYLYDHTCVGRSGHKMNTENKSSDHFAICSAPFGSASLLPISWAYMRLLGPKGLKRASQTALLNANYMLKRLRDYYNIRYVNSAGMCAHEFIIDCSQFSKQNIDVIDIAKRLMDYGM
ncbi:glycine dehydrogenase [Schistosoma bovis]|uniref:glycine dehydrogenase (aminomethyl-transferring) n=1 Tax=Schistosoma bovis TaxID=6184 RepID=A0A430Q759_SCHBO|nr:glycine dehydrogenase [Schistosoma bovis]